MIRYMGAVALTLGLFACGGGDPPPEMTMREWATEYGYLFDDLSEHMSEIETATDEENLGALGGACTDFGDAVDRAQDAPPMPLAEVNDHWQAGLIHFGQAAEDCGEAVESAVSGSIDSGLVDSAGEQLRSGSAEFAKASDLLP